MSLPLKSDFHSPKSLTMSYGSESFAQTDDVADSVIRIAARKPVYFEMRELIRYFLPALTKWVF